MGKCKSLETAELGWRGAQNTPHFFFVKEKHANPFRHKQ